ncbi:hypothetical protein [Oleidesulfovibrio sp.]|uniref:hypothetical protein n=1 Tax=Oleidesulfovibrio sp. TaxID=2909707 RepID=UPI003A886811
MIEKSKEVPVLMRASKLETEPHSGRIQQEYRYMLDVLGSESEVWKSLQGQFGVLNQRTQAIFGIGALLISVTGFSGHRMVVAGMLSGVPLIVGLLFVLVSLGIALFGVTRLHWISAMQRASVAESMCLVIAVRNKKTILFLWSLKCMLAGMVWYVFAVINYLYQASMGAMPIL